MTNHMDENEVNEGLDCASVRDRLPLHYLGLLTLAEDGGLDAHLEHCSACRDEAAWVRRLQCARSEPPAGLSARIVAAAMDRPLPSRRRASWLWALPAAALFVLALGIGTIWNGENPEEIWSLALEPESTMRWFGNDWVVADDPQLHALPDDVLRQILVELGP